MYSHFNIIPFTFLYPKLYLPLRFPKYDVVSISYPYIDAISLIIVYT